MRILPKEKYDELNGMIEAVRAQYPLKKYELGSKSNRIQIWLEDNTRAVVAGDIVDGREYGVLGLSPMANAYSKKTGRWCPYHGDIYVTVWTWSGEARRLMNKDAWGGVTALSLDFVKCLIEFP